MKMKHIAIAVAALALPGVSVASATPTQSGSAYSAAQASVLESAGAPVNGVRAGVRSGRKSHMSSEATIIAVLGVAAVGGGIAAAVSSGHDHRVSP